MKISREIKFFPRLNTQIETPMTSGAKNPNSLWSCIGKASPCSISWNLMSQFNYPSFTARLTNPFDIGILTKEPVRYTFPLSFRSFFIRQGSFSPSVFSWLTPGGTQARFISLFDCCQSRMFLAAVFSIVFLARSTLNSEGFTTPKANPFNRRQIKTSSGSTGIAPFSRTSLCLECLSTTAAGYHYHSTDIIPRIAPKEKAGLVK